MMLQTFMGKFPKIDWGLRIFGKFSGKTGGFLMKMHPERSVWISDTNGFFVVCDNFI